MLPVHLKQRYQDSLVITSVKKVDGDLFALRDDLDKFLRQK